ncbi:MAG: hypothetical protein ACTSXT_13785 [Candidatus Helarchaeota archaeon]
MLKIKIEGIKETEKKLKKNNKKFAILMQMDIGEHLDRVRKGAADLMIANTAGTPNPYRARKKQPSIPGKLTVRTGKWKYLLRWDKSHLTRIGRIIAKKETPALRMKVRNVKLNGIRNRLFEGTIKAEVKNIGGMPYQVGTTGGKDRMMPRETKKTIEARALHEFKGRKIFEPSNNRNIPRLIREVKKDIFFAYGTKF